MNELPGSILADYLEGALSFRVSGEGLQPLRLSDRAMDFSHEALRSPIAAEACNGVRLRFHTDATTVTVEMSLVISERTAFALDVGGMSAPAIDLVVDGALRERRILPHHDRPQVNTFDGLSLNGSVVEVWLPHNVGAVIHRLSSDAPLDPVVDSRPRWLVHGSSISHDAQAEGPSDTWPAQLARARGWHLTHLGFRGECHLDPFVAREIAGARADLVTLELGINVHNFQSMRERTFSPAVHGFLQTIRDTLPDTPLTVVSPVFGAERESQASSVTLDGRELHGDLTLSIIRDILHEAVSRRRDSGDQRVFAVNGLDLLGPGDARLFPDGLHPNAEGSRLIAQRIAPSLPG